jgi:hypothetical protein
LLPLLNNSRNAFVKSSLILNTFYKDFICPQKTMSAKIADLCTAIYKGDKQRLDFLLEQKASPDTRVPGRTLLVLAIHNSPDLVASLLEHGASLNPHPDSQFILYDWVLSSFDYRPGYRNRADYACGILDLLMRHGAAPLLTLRREFDNVLSFAMISGKILGFTYLDKCNEKYGRPRSRIHSGFETIQLREKTIGLFNTAIRRVNDVSDGCDYSVESKAWKSMCLFSDSFEELHSYF